MILEERRVQEVGNEGNKCQDVTVLEKLADSEKLLSLKHKEIKRFIGIFNYVK